MEFDDTRSNEALFERAKRVIPGGVNSPVRSFASVGGTPYFVDHGKGPYVWDCEGRKYLDYVQSYGASILGHADDRVVSAVCRAAELGTTFGAPTKAEVDLASSIVARVPGVEMVRLTSSGTEATMTAIRIARGYTKREKILKFDGCYHGHSDSLLAAAGSGVASLGLPGSAGVSKGSVGDTVVAPYNQIPDLNESFAAIIVEPVAANMGLVPPSEGFLEGLAKACSDVGALLIFDEVITGFRVDFAGASGALGITPDLWSFGKVIGGGLPIGAVAGSAKVMESLAPTGPIYQAGTLSGNPIATAAGLAALEALDISSYKSLQGRAEQLAQGLERVFSEAGLEAQVVRYASILGIFFGSSPVRDYSEAKRSVDLGIYPKFFHAMLSRGVALPPGPYEVFFPSLSHGYEEIESTIDIASAAAYEVVSALEAEK